MKVSAKTEYACIAMLELAAQYGSNEPVRIRKIAERHDVPPRFLVQILLQLKGAGLVSSVRGAAGGYTAEGASPCAYLSADEKCGRLFREAFADVRAKRALAHGVEAAGVQLLLKPGHIRKVNALFYKGFGHINLVFIEMCRLL